MPPIHWMSLEAHSVENVLSMLLNHLYPTSQRIDGSGGDGGRDVQLQLSDGLHVFEIKSFAARLGTAQKAQVRRSLMRAATLAPADWTVLIPIDFTPAEIRWFDGLASLVSFPIHVLGKTRLETELAQRPFIQRYYIEDAHDEVARLVKLYRVEEAALEGGVLDAVARIERVVAQLNELDPFYSFEIQTDGSNTRVRAIPRYERALQDRPIEITVGFRFPDDAAGREAARQLEEHLDFGTPVAIPGEYIERFNANFPLLPSSDFSHGRIEMSSRAADGPPHKMLAQAVAPDGRIVAELPLAVTVTSAGRRGLKAIGHDRTHCLTIEMTIVAGEQGQLNARFRPTIAYTAFDMRMLARFLDSLQTPNVFVLNDNDGLRLGRAEIYTATGLEHIGDLEKLMEDLVLIQWAAGMEREVGPDFTQRDLEAVDVAARLLRGEDVHTHWDGVTISLTDDASDATRALFQREGFQISAVVGKPHVATFGGVDYLVGRGTEFKLASAVLAPEHDDLRSLGIPQGASLRLVPGADRSMRMRLASEEQVRALTPSERVEVTVVD